MTDMLQVANAINFALDMHRALCAAVGEYRQGGTERRAATREAVVPINVEVFDQRDLIGSQIVEWARLVEEESGQQCERLTPQVAGRWMVERADWIAGAGWAPDMIEELRSSAKRSEAMLGLLPRRTRLAHPCECGAEQWIIHEQILMVRCAYGHEAPLADHGDIPDGEPLTVTQAARVTGVARRTITRMIDRGDIEAVGVPPKIARHDITKIRAALAL